MPSPIVQARRLRPLSLTLAFLASLAACGGGAATATLGQDSASTVGSDLTQNTVGQLTARVNAKACLDVVNTSRKSGASVQIWRCNGGANQTFQINQNTVQVYGTLCLTASGSDNGSAVTVTTCDSSNADQNWKVRGALLVNVASGRCLDVRDGGIVNGTRVQIWDCNKANSNQVWTMPNQQNVTPQGSNAPVADGNDPVSDPNTAGSPIAPDGNGVTDPNGSATPVATTGVADVDSAVTNPVAFSDWGIGGGFTAISLNDLLAKHPQLAGYEQNYVAAAAQASPVLPPQLLVAVCLQESSGGQNVGSYGGPFQFTDDGAWAQFGPPGGDRNSMADAAIGAANYIAYLLQNNGGDLNAALRSYNGPISQGGLPSYQSDIQAWMQGTLVYGSGV